MPGFVVLLQSGAVVAVHPDGKLTTLVAPATPAKPCDPRRPGIHTGWQDTVGLAASSRCMAAINRGGRVRVIDRTTGNVRYTRLATPSYQVPLVEVTGRIPIIAIPAAPDGNGVFEGEPPLYRLWALADAEKAGNTLSGAEAPPSKTPPRAFAHIGLLPPTRVFWMASVSSTHLLVCTPERFRVFAIDQDTGNATEETVSELNPMPDDARFAGYNPAGGGVWIATGEARLALRPLPLTTDPTLHTWLFKADDASLPPPPPFRCHSRTKWVAISDGAGATLGVCTPAGHAHVPWLLYPDNNSTATEDAATEDAAPTDWSKLYKLHHPVAMCTVSP